MCLGHVPVNLAMRRSDAQSSGAEIFFYRVVSDYLYRERSADKINFISFPDILFIAFILRMDRDGGVSELGLRSGGGNRDGEVLGIFESIKLRVAFLVNHLVVGNGCLAFWIPINHLKIAINESRVIHLFESGFNCCISFLVERESFPVPVHGSAHLFYLMNDGVVAFARELVYPFQKFFTAQVVPIFTFGFIDERLNF